jgi:hypothetical protein
MLIDALRYRRRRPVPAAAVPAKPDTGKDS